MTAIKITIPSQPIAKRRPKFFRRGNFVGAYNPQETEEGMCALQVMEQLKRIGIQMPINGPLHMACEFFLKRPSSHFGSGKNSGCLKPSAPQYPIGKPDCDNLVKFVMDVMNRCGAWNDDAQVVTVQARKRFTDPLVGPSTVIWIEQEDQ